MDTDSETQEATAERAKEIRAINTETVHKICSGQVIFGHFSFSFSVMRTSFIVENCQLFRRWC